MPFFKDKLTGQVFGYDDEQAFEIAEKRADNKFEELTNYPPVLTDAEKLSKWRENCTISAVALRLALIDMQILSTVQNAVKTASDAMQVKWEYANSIKRNDSDLVNFAKTQLSMADSEIDEVFRLAETK